MKSPVFALGLLTIALAGCEQDLVAEIPDAGPDAAAPLVGDFSCGETAWPTTAPDPLAVRGMVIDQQSNLLGNVPIEVRDLATDALLAQGMTGTGATLGGRYNVSTPTGGVARPFYRKVLPTNGYPVHSIIDPIAEFRPDISYAYVLQSANAAQDLASLAGTTSDPAKGNMIVSIVDCDLTNLDFVEGATVEVPPGSTALYGDPMGRPVASLKATSSKGELFVLNVPPGQVDIVIHAGPVTYRAWSVPIHAGEWTYSQRKP